MDDQEAIDIASQHWGDPQKAAESVVKAAFRKSTPSFTLVQSAVFTVVHFLTVCDISLLMHHFVASGLLLYFSRESRQPQRTVHYV